MGYSSGARRRVSLTLAVAHEKYQRANEAHVCCAVLCNSMMYEYFVCIDARGSIHTKHARTSSTKTQCSYRLMRGPPTHNQGLTSAYVLSHNRPHTYYLYDIPHTYFWALAATHHDATAEQHMLQEIHTRDGVYCFAGGFCLCLVHRLQAAIGAEDVGRGSANYRRFLPRWC